MDVNIKKSRLATATAWLWLSASTFSLLPSYSHALGLGKIRVDSHLNQHLQAEIPLLSASPTDLETLSVRISAQSFEGLSASGQDFGYELAGSSRKPLIRLYSTKPLREPLINFLIEVEWAQGRLLREFAVLLNPPPFNQRVTTAGSRPTLRLPRQTQGGARSSQRFPSPERAPALATPAEAPAPSEPPAAPAATELAGDAATYRVKRGDTLWRIASRLRPDDSVSLQDMMQAFLEKNPQAFVRNDINALKAGALLQVPSFGVQPQATPQTAVATATPAPQTEVRLVPPDPVEDLQPASSGTSAETVAAAVAEADTAPDPQTLANAAGEEAAESELGETTADTTSTDTISSDTTSSDTRSGARPQQPAAPVSSRLRVASFEELQNRIGSLATGDNAALTALQNTADDAASLDPSPATSPSPATTSPAETGDDAIAAVDTAPDTATDGAADGANTAAEPPPATSTDVADAADTADASTATAGEPTDSAAVPAAAALDDASPAGEAEAAENPALADETPVAETVTAETAPDLTADAADTAAVASETAVDTAAAPSGLTETVETVETAGTATNLAGAEQQRLSLIETANVADEGRVIVPSDWVGRLAALSEDPSRIVKDPQTLALVGAPFALLGLGLAWMVGRRRSTFDEPEPALEPEISLADQIRARREQTLAKRRAAAAAKPAARSPAAAATAAATQSSEAQGSDNPLERIDLLLAVGNFREAENVARLALADEPDNVELLGKVLDIHFAADNKEKFLQHAQHLRTLVADNHPTWGQAQSMGNQLCPDHALFLGTAGAARSPALADTAAHDETGTETTRVEPFSAGRVAAAASPSLATAGGDDELDFEGFNFQAPEVDLDNEDLSEVQITQLAQSDSPNLHNTLEFDLSGDSAREHPDEVTLKLDDNRLDFDFDDLLDDGETTLVSPEPEPDDSKTMAFTFEGIDSGIDATPLDDIDVSFDTDPSSVSTLAEVEDTLLVGLDDATDQALSSDDDGVDTKIELANAYLDMDDSDGARSLLNEVLEEGSPQQQQRAREMLERLG